MEENIYKASSLCAWLIKEKGVKRNVAVIIASNKHKVPLLSRSQVSKKATELMNEWGGKQESLL